MTPVGSNDASFNTGNGFNDSILATRHFGANVVQSIALALSNALDSTNGVKTQANTGSAGGNIWWINLGGIKLMWGQTATVQGTTTGGTNGQINFPTFFTTIQMAVANIMGTQTTNQEYVNWGGGYPTTTTGILNMQSASNTPATVIVGWFIIGT